MTKQELTARDKGYCQTYYYKSIQERKCVSCPKPAMPGILKCKKHRDYGLAFAKKYRAARKAAGLCTVCKKPAKKAWRGRMMCLKHRNLYLQRAKEAAAKNMALGLCRRCKSPAKQDRTMCQKHLDEVTAYNKKVALKRKNKN